MKQNGEKKDYVPMLCSVSLQYNEIVVFSLVIVKFVSPTEKNKQKKRKTLTKILFLRN